MTKIILKFCGETIVPDRASIEENEEEIEAAEGDESTFDPSSQLGSLFAELTDTSMLKPPSPLNRVSSSSQPPSNQTKVSPKKRVTGKAPYRPNPEGITNLVRVPSGSVLVERQVNEQSFAAPILQNVEELKTILPNAIRSRNGKATEDSASTGNLLAVHLALLKYSTEVTDERKRSLGLLPPKGFPEKYWICLLGGCRFFKNGAGAIDPVAASELFSAKNFEVEVKKRDSEFEEFFLNHFGEFFSSGLGKTKVDFTNSDWRPLCLLPLRPSDVEFLQSHEAYSSLRHLDKGCYFLCPSHFNTSKENCQKAKKKLLHVFEPEHRLEGLVLPAKRERNTKGFQEELDRLLDSYFEEKEERKRLKA